MQLVLADSEMESSLGWGARSLGLSELQCFEEHAQNIESVRVRRQGDRETAPAKGCQERDQRFRIPRGKGNAELAKGQRGWLCVYRGLPGLDVRDWPAGRVIAGGQLLPSWRVESPPGTIF